MKKKLLYRADDKLISTEFTFSRFLIPHVNNYKSWALFCNYDFLWLKDIKELFGQRNDKSAVMVAQHYYTPKTKIDGRKQLLYTCKNWSSMVLWNCQHSSNKIINLDTVNNQTGNFLHKFGWLGNQLIGKIDYSWNWLVGWCKLKKNKNQMKFIIRNVVHGLKIINIGIFLRIGEIIKMK